MNELTANEKKMIERAKAFSEKINDKYIFEMLTIDGIGPLSSGIFSDGKSLTFIVLLGADDAMRVAFALGAAWERELHEGDNPKLLSLLNDISLDEGEYHE